MDAGASHNAKQTAYQIIVNNGAKWDSGQVSSNESTHIAYAGLPLASGERTEWKVRIWGELDQPSEWSETSFWQMGLLKSEDWIARWISLPSTRPVSALQSPSYLRRDFQLTKPLLRATLYATARGVYLPYLNGKRIGNTLFAPGWTDYKKRIAYQTYDVTNELIAGANTIGAIIGDGWYAGYVAWGHRNHFYGTEPQLLAQLFLEYADGSSDTIVTDDSWCGANGPIVYSDILAGEYYDSRIALAGWSSPGFDKDKCRPVKVEKEHDTSILLTAQIDPPIRKTEEIPAKSVSRPMPGSYIFDLGQNMVGWVRLKIQGAPGTIVRLRYGEMLEQRKSLYVDNLRGAEATDTFILSGSGIKTFEPHFTFHGFRFVEVTGAIEAPTTNAITGIVIHSDTPKTGSFECGSPLVNQLVKNIDWGQRGNFIGVPTDCPQRDERLGWMGDAQVFVRTAAANRDVAGFFEKWMVDVVDAQSAEGAFSDVAPRAPNPPDGAPAWADAGVIVPWTIYQVYGSRQILTSNYSAMTAWIDFLVKENPNFLWLKRRNNDYGDWLSIEADTNKDLLATAYFAYDAWIMARIASVLNKQNDASKYEQVFENIKQAFNKTYVAEDGKVLGNTQTSYLLALRFNLLPDHLRPLAAKHLVDDIKNKGNHLSTGFIGVGYLCPVLSDAGYSDIAYTLLLNKTFPSWGYSIEHGATTIWERWDGWTEEKGFQDVGMNSFNHYSLGSVGEWLQRYAAGIDNDPDAPGFKHFFLHPHPDRRLGYVTASFESVHGTIASHWEYNGDDILLKMVVPANTTATITLPNAERTTHEVGAGTYEYAVKADN
jgi:alpha-L-rhamnosidase